MTASLTAAAFAAGIFMLCFGITFWVHSYVAALRSRPLARLERYFSAADEPGAESDEEAGEPRADSALRRLLRRTGKVFEARDYTRKIESELQRAGIPLRGSEFVVLNILSVAAGAVLGWLISGGAAVAAFALATLGAIMPSVYVRMRKQKRLAQFDRQIPDALTVISNSLRAGYSFLQSMEMVSREMKPPISAEFARVLREMNLGSTTETALMNLVKRVPSDDIDLVVTAVIIQRQVGGNLSEILDTISETIRQRIKIRGDLRTLTAQGRTSGIIISLLPVALCLLLSVINPEYISLLFGHPLGRVLLGYAVISQLIGIAMIRKIVQIDV